MKIILAGYGKMGQLLETLAMAKGHEIIAIFDRDQDWDKLPDLASNADVMIEFSQPESAVENFRKCLNARLPIVTGTTGWYGQMEVVKEMQAIAGTGFLYATNFSIGMNLFFELNRVMARLGANHPQYKVSLQEIHHTRKLDQPSGTAITLAGDIISIHPEYQAWANESNAERGLLAVESIREGDVTGTHVVKYQSDADLIELRHEAFSRQGFAEGALLAAEWLQGRQGFYEFRDILFSDGNI